MLATGIDARRLEAAAVSWTPSSVLREPWAVSGSNGCQLPAARGRSMLTERSPLHPLEPPARCSACFTQHAIAANT
eukprot:8808660-Alexandrium_andersonii.AAC.1